MDPLWYVVQRLNAYHDWDDVKAFETYTAAHEFYLTRTQFRLYRIIRRVGCAEKIVRDRVLD